MILNTETLKESFEKEKRHIQDGYYNAAANQMRSIAEYTANFYVNKYKAQDKVAKKMKEKKMSLFLAQINILRTVLPYDDNFRWDLLLFLELSMKIGNAGSHGNADLSEIEDYKVKCLADLYETDIKKQFEKDHDEFNNSFQLTDVTKKFNGRTISILSCISGCFAGAYDDMDGKPVYCNIKIQKAWESFLVQVNKDGWATLRPNTESRLYLMADLDADYEKAPIKANSSNRQKWEMFRIYKQDDFYFIQSGGNGKFLSCMFDDKPNYPLYACKDKNDINYWEKFEIKIL